MKYSDNAKGHIYAATAGLLWGLLAIVLKVATAYVPPSTIAWSRFVVAFFSLFIYHIVYRTGGLSIFRKPPIGVIFSAILLGANYVTFMEGIHITTPNNAAIFIQSGPLLLAVFGIVIYHEKLKPLQLLGFMIAILGFFFFYRDQFSSLFGKSGVYNKGVLLIVTAGVCWAVYSLLQKKLVLKHQPGMLNLINFGLPILILLPRVEFVSFIGLPWFMWFLIVFLGLNTMLAYQFLAMALKYTEANKISIILSTNPIITFLGMGLLTFLEVDWIEKEIFSGLSMLGALFVILGAVFISVYKK